MQRVWSPDTKQYEMEWVLPSNGADPAAPSAGSTLPAGTVLTTIASTPDPGFIFIDGSTVANAQAVYPTTWQRIPASWKSGADMVLPDWRGRVLVSDDAAAAFTIGGSGGSNTHAITQAELPAVSVGVTITDPGHFHYPEAFTGGAAGPTKQLPYTLTNHPLPVGIDDATTTNTTGISAATAALGSGTAMSTLPAYGVVNYQLKVH